MLKQINHNYEVDIPGSTGLKLHDFVVRCVRSDTI